MSSALHRTGAFAARRPWVVIAAWVLASLVVLTASYTVGGELEDSLAVPGLDSQRAADLLAAAGSDEAGLTAQVVLAPAGTATFVDSAEAAAALRTVETAVTRLPHVIGASTTLSPDGSIALIGVQYPVVEELDAADLRRLEDFVVDTSSRTGLQVEARGELFFAFDEGETGTAELIGLGAAVIILLLAFGSVLAMGLPIGLALLGLGLGVSAMSLVTHVVEIPSFAPQMASMIGLGVGIDYALFLVTRHREYLSQGLDVVESAGLAVATAGRAVIFAGGTVVVAILGLAVAGIPFMTAAGIATSMIVAIMVLASVTLLPALLGLAGHRIIARGRRGAATRRMPRAAGRHSRWRRWGRHVGGHAWVYTIAVSLLLLALTAPVLGLRLGFPDDGTAPTSSTQRRAYDLVAEHFGPGINGPLLIAVDLDGDPGVVAPMAAAVAADEGIAAVAPPEVDRDADVATIVAIPRSAPQDDATVATLERLRDQVVPTVLAASDATAHIGGATANFVDLGTKVAQRLPWFVAAVVLLSFVLLTAVFRSVVVAAKAAILNLLSIGAAYGVLVMVFQWGWGLGLVGLEATVPIVAFLPMFMFAVLFGLSMDYEVFLLSRVREEYLATGDNDTAVIDGLASTARVITSAALIMIAVFGGFVLGADPILKMLGLGLATAILVDATIVRVVLVPATMTLMGEANWWLPRWLDRLLPTVDLEGNRSQRRRVPTPAPTVHLEEDQVAVEVLALEPTGERHRRAPSLRS